jgi:hypothetical protein
MKALGLIETIGLATAFEAADAALKAANVKLLGYENTKGGGRITVKFVGDVGAVKAAVAAGIAAALRIGRVESSLVIARPHQAIEGLIGLIDRGPAAAGEPVVVPQPAPAPEAPAPAPEAPAPAPEAPAPAPEAPAPASEAPQPAPAKAAKPKAAAGKAKRPASRRPKAAATPVPEASLPASDAAATPAPEASLPASEAAITPGPDATPPPASADQPGPAQPDLDQPAAP